MTKFIIGLGNPGQKYLYTRHNVGFMVIERLVEFLLSKQNQLAQSSQPIWQLNNKAQFEFTHVRLASINLVFIKPQTFMNKVGLAVMNAKKKYPKLEPNDMFVIHDDLDLVLGNFKIQLGTGPKQHYGLQSIDQFLGTDQFWHVRVGVDGRKGDRVVAADQYVLSGFTKAEQLLLTHTIKNVVYKLGCQLLDVDNK